MRKLSSISILLDHFRERWSVVVLSFVFLILFLYSFCVCVCIFLFLAWSSAVCDGRKNVRMRRGIWCLRDQLSGQGKRASRHNESTPARTKSTSESEKETYSIFRDVACSGRWSDRER
ncbi:hypothetical protein P167DRAFT_47678 [Morchella conica CCBAS932]|uniref:Uncharacterized protein n=1 Tax=Morchella conica CCBAS932 TaxID=1392247 RepID=A0A3N4KZN5_9PEZI|nr:hypothetical protein P167DRAFT_47678 [Morchella conica CCBAS932]